MKQFKGYEEAKKAAQYVGGAKLPAGAYVCKVMAVRYEENDWGDRIIVQLDIAEGEYKDFFRNQFNNNQADDKKWKGIARISVPSDDGSERDGWTKNAFATWTNGFESSNEGYRWEWDESTWKDKIIGITFRTVNKAINGKPVTYTEAFRGCSADLVRQGAVKTPNSYTAQGYDEAVDAQADSAQTGSEGFMSIPDNITDEEFPF